MKSGRTLVKKAVKESRKQAKSAIRSPDFYPELPYRSEKWREIYRAVDQVIAERKAREAKTKG